MLLHRLEDTSVAAGCGNRASRVAGLWRQGLWLSLAAVMVLTLAAIPMARADSGTAGAPGTDLASDNFAAGFTGASSTRIGAFFGDTQGLSDRLVALVPSGKSIGTLGKTLVAVGSQSMFGGKSGFQFGFSADTVSTLPDKSKDYYAELTQVSFGPLFRYSVAASPSFLVSVGSSLGIGITTLRIASSDKTPVSWNDVQPSEINLMHWILSLSPGVEASYKVMPNFYLSAGATYHATWGLGDWFTSDRSVKDGPTQMLSGTTVYVGITTALEPKPNKE